MKKTILIAALTMSACATAQTSEYHETCKGTIEHARKYASKESLPEILNGQWEIITSDKVNDMGKLTGLTLFNVYQQAAYDWTSIMEKHGDVETFEDVLFNSCLNMMEKYEIVEKLSGPTTAPTYESIY